MSRRAAFGGQLTGTDSTPSSTSAPPPGLTRPQQPQGSQGTGSRGKGKQRARTASNAGAKKQENQPAETPTHPSLAAMNAAAAALAKAADEAGEENDAICFICAEPVQYWALGQCSHRTCHSCSIRLRALYKKKECTFCKTECASVIFTEDEEKPFEEYTAEQTPFSDSKLGILFETRAQLDDTLSLLRFNCPYKPGLSTTTSAAPDSPESPEACPQILSGWTDLKRHVRAVHQTTLCDLCCSNKKIFAHEHELFALPPPQTGNGRGRRTELDEHQEKHHAMCGFCKRWFYDSDGLYKHCREQHEECFICTRQGIRHQYHLNYDRLEQHFKLDHYLCPHPECLAKKFTVFESELDLQAHALVEHGVGSTAGGDQKARKEARRIETHFTYSTGESTRSGGGDGRRRGPNGRQAAASFVEPVREEQAPRGERRVPGLGPIASSSGGGSRAARFGGQLTAPAATDSSPSSSGASTPRPGAAGGAENDAATVAKHEQLLRRVHGVVNGNEGKVAGFRFSVRSYRNNELSAADLVDQLFHVFDRNIDTSASIITSLADLFVSPSDESRRTAILSAWRDLRIEQNQFPSLAPLAPALNGVPTAPHNTAQRALSAQHRSAGRGAASSTWDRVERAATSSGPAPVAPRSNPFPALMGASNAKAIPGLSKAGQQSKRATGGPSTAWSAASAASSASAGASNAFPSLSSNSRPPSAAHTPVSVSRPSSSAASARASVGSVRLPPRAEFPSLPASTAAADKRAAMRAALQRPQGRTVLDPGSPGNSWNGGQVSPSAVEAEEAQNAGGKKKGKGRQKVFLMSSGLASQTNQVTQE
ncbi:hypothetical protein JCM11641_001714 [Rhodosporidiobolus odoratus]